MDSNHAQEKPIHDAAGNLVYDGLYKYTYDAWNRLCKVQRAYRDESGALTTGSTIATLEYDGLGRRIEKKVENSADWNATYHYYYDDQRMVEVRRDFGGETPNFRVVKQYAWGLQYIDELIWIGVNIDPADTNESNGGACERWFWALHDVNYNVIGLTATVGSPVWVEQYEYTPYGERTVYSRNWLLADVDEDGDVDEDDEWLIEQYEGSGTDNTRYDLDRDGDVDSDDTDIVNGAIGQSVPSVDPNAFHPRLESSHGLDASGTALLTVDLCDIGHQGLLFDKEWGTYYNRARTYNPRLARFHERDPKGYVDGMSLYQYVRSSPVTGRDPMGLEYVEVEDGVALWAVERDIPLWPDKTVGWVRLGPVEGGRIRLESKLGGGSISLSRATGIASAHASMGGGLTKHAWPSAIKHALAGERTPLSQKGASTITVVASGFGAGVRDYSIVVAAHVPLTGTTLDRKAEAIVQAAKNRGDIASQVGYGMGEVGVECLIAATGGKTLQVLGKVAAATSVGQKAIQIAGTPVGRGVLKGVGYAGKTVLGAGVARESYKSGEALYEGDYEAATLHAGRVGVALAVTAKATSGSSRPRNTGPSPRSPVGSSRGEWVGGGNRPTTIGRYSYSGHAIDQMQNRGIPPSAVENTIRNGVIEGVGNTPGTYRMYEPVNNITVILNDSGRFVTVYRGHGGGIIMGAMMSDYDRRQVNMIKRMVHGYQHGDIGIGSFIGNIAALVGVMEKTDSQWAEKVLSLVHGIEEIYAVVLDAGRLSLHESEQASVDRLVGELKGLLV